MGAHPFSDVPNNGSVWDGVGFSRSDKPGGADVDRHIDQDRR